MIVSQKDWAPAQPLNGAAARSSDTKCTIPLPKVLCTTSGASSAPAITWLFPSRLPRAYTNGPGARMASAWAYSARGAASFPGSSPMALTATGEIESGIPARVRCAPAPPPITRCPPCRTQPARASFCPAVSLLVSASLNTSRSNERNASARSGSSLSLRSTMIFDRSCPSSLTPLIKESAPRWDATSPVKKVIFAWGLTDVFPVLSVSPWLTSLTTNSREKLLGKTYTTVSLCDPEGREIGTE